MLKANMTRRQWLTSIIFKRTLEFWNRPIVFFLPCSLCRFTFLFPYRSSVATSQIKENWFNSKSKTINVRSGFRWQSPFDRIECNFMCRKQNPFNLVKLSSLWHDSYEECVWLFSSYPHIFSLKQQRWANSFKQIYYRWMAQFAHSLSLHPSNCVQNGTEEKWLE